MKKPMLIAVIAAAVVVIVLIAVLLYGRCMRKNHMLDGPGMVYEWPNYELYTDWVEVDPPEGYEPTRLDIREGRLTMTDWNGKKSSYPLSLPESVDTCGKPAGEVYLKVENCVEFDDFIFHEETVGEAQIPVISCTIFEYDGRGEIVIAEFVPSRDIDRLPGGFRSSSLVKRNDWEPAPTYVELPAEDGGETVFRDAPEAGDLLCAQTFYALLPKSRYGGSCEEGDYAFGRFLIWADVVERSEDGGFVNAERVAVPYIVSGGGSRENLSLLSGGPDGLDPYGSAVYALTTDEAGEIIDAVVVQPAGETTADDN